MTLFCPERRGARLNELAASWTFARVSAGWLGRMFLGTGRLVYAGPLGAAAAHAHHAHQLLLTPGDPMAVAGPDGVEASGAAFFIPANQAHAIVRPAAAGLLILVDPDDLEGRALRAVAPPEREAASWRAAAARLAGGWVAPSTWEEAQATARGLVARLAGEHARPQVQHPAVKRALRALPAAIAAGEVRLADVAGEAGVSPSRLAHLFSQELGIPMRPYVLWLRLHRASASIAAGATLTQAAHDAGFADGAHFSRVCRRMFGISPSEGRAIAWVPPPAEDGAEPHG